MVLFLVAPLIALKGLEGRAIFQLTIKRLETDPFMNLALIMIALLPLVIIVSLLLLAVVLTGALFVDYHSSPQTILKWFFIMLPFTAFLSPAVIFFFNFAAEAHVLMQKQMKQ